MKIYLLSDKFALRISKYGITFFIFIYLLFDTLKCFVPTLHLNIFRNFMNHYDMFIFNAFIKQLTIT